MSAQPESVFFESPGEMEAWLEAHGREANELWVGLVKKGTGTTGIVYAEALDAALCHGWIDGVRRTLDDARWTIRFTPRRPGSIWSRVNIRRAEQLEREGRLRPAGLAAFEARREENSERYSYEQGTVGLEAEAEARFRADDQAWAFFQTQPPWYRRTSTWWIMSARRPETRQRRLESLIDCSRRETRIPQLARTPKEPEG